MHRTDKYLQFTSFIWSVLRNGCVFVYKLNHCGFDSSYSQLNSRLRACFSKEFLDIHATIECEFILKRARDITRTYSQMHCKDRYSHLTSIIWWIRPNSWDFIYELRDFGFQSSFSHLNLRFHSCLEQEVPWQSDNHRVWIQPEIGTWQKHTVKYIVQISAHNSAQSFGQFGQMVEFWFTI